jgi:translation initiation factor 4A
MTTNTPSRDGNDADSGSTVVDSGAISPRSHVSSDTSKFEFATWEDVEDLNPQLLRGIYAYNFEKPSHIQQRAILPMMAGRDVIAQAQSGTGKTGAFGVGALQLVNSAKREVQALIMAPTRELAKQTYEVLTNLGSQMPGLVVQLLVGGSSTDDDARILKQTPPQIIVGCPGRVHDMIRRRFINPRTIRLFILDEADEMLSYGFKDQIYNIMQFLNKDVQVCLFSATMPQELHALSEKFMRDPVKILVNAEQLTLEGICQYYVALDDDDGKFATLQDLFKTISMSQSIIYCNNVKRVADLTEAMVSKGYPACCIHSGMEKDKRDEAYSNFKAGKYRVLISSDVTARGIDIQQVSTVINFDLPKSVHTYLHRIGRSGRWGRKGTGISFITRRDMKLLRDLEVFYSTTINELPSSFKAE